MATNVKKERSRRTSWLSPMWRDIDSLRKQNESTKKEIESMRRKSKQTETETEQLRIETEILKRQNKALELIESRGLNALLREATIPGGNDSDHSEGQLDLELLEEKLVALGCDVDDDPFLFDVLELSKGKELIPLKAARKVVALAQRIELVREIPKTGVVGALPSYSRPMTATLGISGTSGDSPQQSRKPTNARSVPFFEETPFEKVRDTPSVRLFDITVPKSNARDLVVHSGPAVSPPDDPKSGAWQFYLNPHQENNLLAMQGGLTFFLVNLSWNYPFHIVRLECGGEILRIPPGTFYRSVSDPDGSLVLNQAVRNEGANMIREFRVYNSKRIPRLFAVTSGWWSSPTVQTHKLLHAWSRP
jgi:hypothetical protein